MELQEVDVTTARLLRVWWEYSWRAVLVTIGTVIVSMVVGAIVGALLGLFMTLAGYETAEIQAVAQPIGMVLGALIGIGFSIIPFRIILGKSFGDFRLILVDNTVKSEAIKEEGD